jgi:predicted outer membrane protein
MAHWLLVDNQGEIELAKFAREKSQNEEVKEFATMMIQDHTDLVNGLQQLAGRQNPAAGGQPREGQQRREGQQGQAREGQQGQAREGQQGQDRDAAAAGQAQRQPGQPQAGRPQPGQPQTGQQPGQPAQQAAGGQGFDLVRIKHEIGQQCVASLKEKLSEKKGAEFDKCYMGHQVVAHMQMLDTLKVFQKHADGQLAELINGGIQTTEDHLMHAEEIMKKLEGVAAASTARRPGEQKRD